MWEPWRLIWSPRPTPRDGSWNRRAYGLRLWLILTIAALSSACCLCDPPPPVVMPPPAARPLPVSRPPRGRPTTDEIRRWVAEGRFAPLIEALDSAWDYADDLERDWR